MIRLNVNSIEITQQTIAATRRYFAENYAAIAVTARSPEFWQAAAADTLAGRNDRTLAFAQRALFIQTGASPALF
jgi:hypothetical protein